MAVVSSEQHLSTGEPLYLFSDRSVYDADLAAEHDGMLPDLSLWNGIKAWERDVAGETTADKLLNMYDLPSVRWHWRRNVRELPIYARQLRRALLLPIGEPLRGALHDCLDLALEEAARRIVTSRRRESRAEARFEPWEDADLVAEVEAVAGAGARQGSQWWFHCPLGHSDRTPSLHVDADRRLWHCFGCQAGGGVTAWRKLVAA